MRAFVVASALLTPSLALAAEGALPSDIRPTLAIVFLALGAFHLVLHTRLRDFPEYLFYGLVALSLGVNAELASTGALFGLIDPGERLLRFNFHLGAGLFLRFLYAVLRREMPVPVRVLEGLQYLFAVLMLPVATAHPAIQITLGPRLALVGVIAVICLAVALQEAWRGKREARLLALAGMPLFLASLHDRYQESQGDFGEGCSSYAFGIFVIGMSLVLADRVGSAYSSLASRERDLSALHEATRRFVPFPFLRLLGRRDVREVGLGDGVEREVTVLFSDIRSFTTLSEGMSPSETFAFINRYLLRMEPCVEASSGFIDKYIGDAVLALFPGAADDAVKASLAMLQALEALNAEREEQGEDPIRVGIGINTGPCVLGTIGGPARMDGTVIGDAVNLASRVESLTKTYRARVLLTGPTCRELSEGWAVREIDLVAVKGKRQPVALYELLDADPPALRQAKRDTAEAFASALRAMRSGDFTAAVEGFGACTAAVPDDAVAALLHERSSELLRSRPGGPWNGVARMEHK